MAIRKPFVRGPQADAVYREVSSGLREAGWRLQMAVTECSPEGETARVEYWWRGIRRKSYRTPGLKLRWVQGVSVEMTRLDCLTIDDVNGG